jgi:hypothetical protein
MLYFVQLVRMVVYCFFSPFHTKYVHYSVVCYSGEKEASVKKLFILEVIWMKLNRNTCTVCTLSKNSRD